MILLVKQESALKVSLGRLLFYLVINYCNPESVP